MSKVHLKNLGRLKQLDMCQDTAQYQATSLEHGLDVFEMHHIEASTSFACLIRVTK